MQIFLRWVLTALLVPMVLHFGSPTIVQAQAKTEIVIGASLPLTGSLAAHGRDLKWAYDQIVNSLNENGGILVKDSGKKLKIRLVIADNGTNPMRAASAVEKLIKVDKVDMLLGGADPACVMAGCMAAERYKTGVVGEEVQMVDGLLFCDRPGLCSSFRGPEVDRSRQKT